MAAPTVLEAMNHAMENDGDLLPEANAGIPTVEGDDEGEKGEAPEGESPESETPEGETPEGDEEDEKPEGEEEGAEEGEETDAEAEARGAVRDPVTGKFTKKGEEKTAETKPEAKKPDPLTDPIPKDLKQETKDRIRTLIKTTKEVTTERDEIRTNFDYMVNGIQATGASPEQYGETLSWLALFNSNDPAQQTKALELVETVAERLSTLLGKERTVSDPLAAHADLKEAVRTGKVTSEYAKEIARTRNGQSFRTELTASARQQQEQQTAQEQELQTARNELTDLENALKGTDPNYAAKKKALVPVLRTVFKSIPPSQWKAKFQEAYKAMATPAAAARRTVPVNQPLRAGKQPAGGQTKEPGSMLDAVSGALANFGKG